MSVIYTIGHTESYELYFEEQEHPEKLGRTKDYPGGSVWLTKEEAEKHCPEGYSVYGVNADWDRDTERNLEENWHDLLVTSLLIKV